MEKRNSVKKTIIFALIIVCLVAIVGGTYSRYTSTGTANVNADIAKWSIKLDTDDISTTPVTKDVDLTFDANDYVANDRIAPGRNASFQIVLDPTDSEVAIDYTLHVDSLNITGITNTNSKIAITSATYTIGEGTEAVEETATLTSGTDLVIPESLADVEADKAVTVKVTLSWDNDETLNAADTANGVAAGTVKIPVTVTASQHI